MIENNANPTRVEYDAYRTDLEYYMEQFAGKVKFTQTSFLTMIILYFTDEKSSSFMDRAVASRKEMTYGDLIFTFSKNPLNQDFRFWFVNKH